jgi:catechol 2,3-dioxygenase-like lactoylglutathione lyase family enzyme
MAWYLADIVSRSDGHATVTTHLVEAHDPDEAWEKACALGDEDFVGVHDLTEIHEPLGDGAELAWQARWDADAASLVPKKEQLAIFGARSPDESPDLRPPRVATIDHAQIMIPPGGEDAARKFYGELLGMREIEKPEELRKRGGVWFLAGNRQLHIGVEAPGVERTATRAHVAYAVTRFDAMRARIEGAGVAIKEGENVGNLRRFELRDPFGNRVEIVGR